ncbi:hypothetical protein ACFLTH_17315 [Bacteroidota bacterium]
MKKQRFEHLLKDIRKLEVVESNIDAKKSRIGVYRLIVFLAGLILFLTAFFLTTDLISIIVLSLFVIFFVLISSVQNRIIEFHDKIVKAIEVKKSFTARINLDWRNIPYKRIENLEALDEIEIDLDLCGPQSLHHLIDFSKSLEGSFYLRNLLRQQDFDLDELNCRQKIIGELGMMNRFRYRFLIISALVSKKDLNSDRVMNWIKLSSRSKSIKNVLMILTVLMLFNLMFISLDLLDVVKGLWVFSYFVYIGFYFLSNSKIKNLARDSDFLKEELGKFSKILEYIEKYDFGSNEHIKNLCEPLQQKGKSPSSEIRRITRVVNLLTFRANPFIWAVFIAIGPIDYFLAYLVELYRKGIEKRIPVWMDVWHKLEAYISLGTFAWLNPEYNFPQVVDDEFCFKGKNIGHVLIPFDKKVCNDFSFNSTGDIYVITGSNMSGKSTFLRTIGINLALAYAGGPVNVNDFKTSSLKIFTCIKVSDSVIDGISYFYAEVKRLKRLLTILKENNKKPVLFLIDEIFKGTNNIERRIGSKSYLKSLVGTNTAGIVSTHDIELAKLEKDYPQIKNVHFREKVENDKMIFDYRLRAGACPTTNALKIMFLEGLPVDDES